MSHNWEAHWIETAKKVVYSTYDDYYTPSTINIPQDIVNNDSGDVDDALFQHIFNNKRQKSSTKSQHEMDLYLKNDTIEYQREIDILHWWQVSFIYYINYIAFKISNWKLKFYFILLRVTWEIIPV